jgi:hypothetical protein
MALTPLGTRRPATRGAALAFLASAVASTAVLLPATPAQAAVTNQNLVGSAAGTQVVVLGGVVESGPTAASGLSTPYAGKTSRNSIASVRVAGLASTGVLSTRVATSTITGGKRISSTARVDGLRLLGGLVKATAVESTSTVSVVNGIATPSSAAKFVDLTVAETTIPLNVSRNFTVEIPGVAKVVINKAVGRQLSDNTARENGAGIEITLLEALAGRSAGTVVQVAPTSAAAALPAASLGAPVGGGAYATRITTNVGDAVQVTSGPTGLATMPVGGTAAKNVTNNTAGVHLDTLADAGAVSGTVNGSRTQAASRSTVTSHVAAVQLLGGLIKADAVTALAQASKSATGSVVLSGQSKLVNLTIGGLAPRRDHLTVLAKPWVTIVWNDPVNLMSYVTYVFQKYFGYDKKKAEKLMLEVHEDGSRWSPPAPARRWSATCRRCTSTACGRPWQRGARSARP